ncbi:MAG: RHS repeat domain-containing protein [Blastocatellia bacterium]
MVTNRHCSVVRVCLSIALLVFVIGCLRVAAAAQNISYTENNLDQSLRSNLNVDPSTFGMSFSVPLGNFPGRGAAMPVTLSYSSKVWRTKHQFSWTQFNGTDQSDVHFKFGEYSVAGWTTNLDVPWLEYTGGAQAYDAAGGSICTTCDGSPDNGYFIERIAMHMPDGSTHELRKSDTPVFRYFSQGAPPLTGIYISTDGSRMKYDADAAVLYLPDGSRYLLNASGGVQFIDRNGNTLTYNTTTKQWTDTTGRVISVVLNNTIASGQTQATQTLSLPGFGTATQQYSLVWKKLHVMLGYSSESQMPYTGRENCFSRTNQTPYLYTSFATYEHPCGSLFNPSVLAEINLPNGLKYTFSYNTYGEVTKVTLPTGGYYSYTYAEIPGLDFNNYTALYGQSNRGVTQQRVCETASCTSGQELVWNYSAVNNGTTFVASVTNPLSEKSERTLHVSAALTYYGFDDARSGRAYDERSYNATNVMLRRSLTNWIYSSTAYGTRDARPDKQVGIILDTGGNAMTQTSTMTYDNDLNVTESKSYDYGSVTASTGQTGAITSMPLGTLLKTEESLFVVNDSGVTNATDYRNRHLISLPSKTSVKNGSGVVVAAAEFKYDESDLPLLTYGGTIPGWTNPATNVRGNATSTKRWLDFNGTSFATYPSGSFITTRAQYDQFGNVRKTWDGNNKLSETEYADSFADANNTRSTYAYATKTISPVPDSSGYYSSNTTLNTFATYDFQSGKPTQSKDANNQITNFEYETGNALGRLKRAILPDGGEVKKTYNDVTGSLYILSETKQSATVWLKDETHFDALGRAWKTRHFEGGTQWSEQQTAFDQLGRAWKTANPYFPGASLEWTESKFDALGRVTEVKTPDGAKVTTVYLGTKVTVSDPANKTRRSETDALGRLKQVVEDPNGLNYATNYTYSTTGNLIRVEQGTQYRYFLYDSLSRLLRARNPEQNTNSNLALTPPSDQTTGNTAWALKYVYDSNSNLSSKVDPRNTTTSYGYDAINRNIWTSYNDSLTPTLERHYDAASNGKGRLYYTVNYNLHPVTNAAAYSYTQINGYDAMGRPTGQTQNFLNTGGNWTGYTSSRTYDLAGHPLVQTYPSNRTVTNAYGDSGRLTSNVGTLGDGTSRNYATGITYTAAGLMSRETFGMQASTLYHNLHYNNRLQLVDIRVGDSSTDEWTWNRGALVYYYGTTARDGWNAFANSTDNNGNVLRQVNYVPLSGGGNVIPQLDDYNYDALNRITSVSESQQNSSGGWTFNLFTQNFGYDRWGNRTVSCSPCQSGVTGDTFTVDTTTNRLTAKNGVGMTYDSAGNQTYDATGNRWFDGENLMYKAVQSGTTSYYVYDSDGKRVRRIVGATETWMVYGISGELIAEYASNGAAGSPQKEYGYRGGQMLIVAQTSPLEIRWTVTDHLGTPRMNIQGNGASGGLLSSVKRHDYLPFGEELFAGVGLRSSSSHGYEPPSDGIRQKFTDKERDTETGLDFFEARYFASVQGRFTSPDDFWKDSQLGDPQSWNKYAYVRNNPLKYTDPSGEKATVTITTDEDKKRGTIKVVASVAIWTKDKKISKEAIANASADIKASIESGWQGQFVKDGITYDVTVEITVKAHTSEQAATDSGAQNVIEIVNGDIDSDGTISNAGSGPFFASYDVGKWNMKEARNRTSPHEFGHLMGVGHGDNIGRNVMTQGRSGPTSYASVNDYERAFGSAIASHRNSSRRLERLDDAEPFRHAQTVLGDRFYNHTSTRTLKAPIFSFGWR